MGTQGTACTGMAEPPRSDARSEQSWRQRSHPHAIRQCRLYIGTRELKSRTCIASARFSTATLLGSPEAPHGLAGSWAQSNHRRSEAASLNKLD